ncbi:GATA transcription factor 13 [Hordeum vulgare]|nr:GATA transcription factor 13 [Hordeum vulgare]
MGPSGVDETPFDLLFDSDSGATQNCLVDISALRTNLKNVPCSVRLHLSLYIEECRVVAIRRGDKDIDLALQSSEDYLYGVLFTHGRMRSKFYGPCWEELVKDYGLRHRDMMTVRLENYGTMIGVDIHRDGVMLFPLPCVGKLLRI